MTKKCLEIGDGRPRVFFALAWWALLLAVAPPAAAAVELSIRPEITQATLGSPFEVELTVDPAGSAFNGYDATVRYDPLILRLIARTQPLQEGPLMTGACPNRFHVFDHDEVTGTATVSHVLLCAGTSVTGPGVVYRLQFEPLLDDVQTSLQLEAAFYDAGLLVTPVTANDGSVRVGDPVGAPNPPSALGPRLEVAPNPFNPRTEIRVVLPVDAFVRLRVLNVAGELVDTLIAESLPAGERSLVWRATDPKGKPLSSGVYWLHLETDASSVTTRVTLVR